MTFQPVLAFAWNAAIGIPMLFVGVIVLGLIWLFGQPKKAQGRRRVLSGDPGDPGDQRREPVLGESVDFTASPIADEPVFNRSGSHADATKGGFQVTSRPNQGELDMGLREELEKLGATLAGDRTMPEPATMPAPETRAAAKPRATLGEHAASIVDALRAPSLRGYDAGNAHDHEVRAATFATVGPAAMSSDPEPPRSELGRRPAQLPVERIVTLFLMAREGTLFEGADLVVAAEKAGLEFGDMGIYHRLLDGKRELGPIFSVANMLKPGNFDLSQLDKLCTPGLSFFMTLPGPLSALDAWDAMLPTAQRLAELLDSQVLDEERNALGRQRIAHIRDELRGWDRDHEGKEIIFGRT